MLALLGLGAAQVMEAQVDRRDVRRGNRDFKKENWREAEIDYRKALVKDSLSFAANYNMANTINKFAKYLNLLDEVYQEASLTSVLDGDAALTSAGANANELVIPKLEMDGLANYDRAGGYVEGDVRLTSETVKFNYDRGRAFSVDSMDDEETAGVAFGRLSSEFIRTKTVPEMDAFRFAAYAGKAGNSQSKTFASGEQSIYVPYVKVTPENVDEFMK